MRKVIARKKEKRIEELKSVPAPDSGGRDNFGEEGLPTEVENDKNNRWEWMKCSSVKRD